MEGIEGFIISETTKVFEKAIKRYAKENKVTEDRISILLYLENGEDFYTLCIDNNPYKDVTIKDILGVKIMDIKGYSVILPSHIINILKGLEEEQQSNLIDISVSLDIRGDEDKLRFFLFKDNKVVKEVFLKEIIKT